jgi:hypothetical protein
MDEGEMEVSIWSRLHQLAAVLVSKVGNRRLSSLLVSVMRRKGNLFLSLIGDNICKEGSKEAVLMSASMAVLHHLPFKLVDGRPLPPYS